MIETPRVRLNPEAVEQLNRQLIAMRENMRASGPRIGAAFQQVVEALKRRPQ